MSHAVPEGEGLAGQHAKQGYMLFLNIATRPLWMVFGLLLAFILTSTTGMLLGKGLELFFTGMTSGNVMPVGPLMF